jgi:hypothetical protein
MNDGMTENERTNEEMKKEIEQNFRLYCLMFLSTDFDWTFYKEKAKYVSRINVYFQNGGADDKKRWREKEGTTIVKR